MKKTQLFFTAILSSLLLFSTVTANAKEINEKNLSNKIKAEKFATHIIPFNKGDTLNLPNSYNAVIITNPENGQKFVKIPAKYSKRGLKKAAIVSAFRYGGPNLALVLDTVSTPVATYIRNNSLTIANAIDSLTYLGEGSIIQALIAAGVPTTTARTITWAITTVLL